MLEFVEPGDQPCQIWRHRRGSAQRYSQAIANFGADSQGVLFIYLNAGKTRGHRLSRWVHLDDT